MIRCVSLRIRIVLSTTVFPFPGPTKKWPIR